MTDRWTAAGVASSHTGPGHTPVKPCLPPPTMSRQIPDAVKIKSSQGLCQSGMLKDSRHRVAATTMSRGASDLSLSAPR